MATALFDQRTELAPELSPALLPLFREVGNLKRVRSAGREGSVASRLFRASWGRLLSGWPPAEAGLTCASEALAATGLGDLDRLKLLELGLSEAEARSVLRSAVARMSEPLDLLLRGRLVDAAGPAQPAIGSMPAFVTALEEQPRAGVTCPKRGRLTFQPAESHAEHCAVVGVYAVLLAPVYEADPGKAFLAGLGHHLHNAAMPDSGFAGEMLLGPHLDPLVVRSRNAVLRQLPPMLGAGIADVLKEIASDRSGEARAFHAADAIDRVLEIEQHIRLREVGMSVVLDEFELVHAGPVKSFQDEVLGAVGLA